MRRLLVAVAVFALLGLPGGATTAPVEAAGWSNFQLGNGSLETCPSANTTPPACTNHQGEPQIRADRSGIFYGASENGVGSGTEAWRSIDAGKHYTHLVSPNAVSARPPKLHPWRQVQGAAMWM